MYSALFVRPYVWIARLDRDDVVDSLYEGLGRIAVRGNAALSAGQSGLIRWYVTVLAAGVAIFLAIVVFA